MQPPPLPLVPLLLSTVFIADASPGLDPWKLLEKWGIAFVMGAVAWLLYKRTEREERAARKRHEAMEAERLKIQEALLDSHKENATLQAAQAKSMESLIVANMRTQQQVTEALHDLNEKVHSIPCKKI